MWGHGGIRKGENWRTREDSVKKGIRGVSSRQGTGILSGESGWGDLLRKRWGCVQGSADLPDY